MRRLFRLLLLLSLAVFVHSAKGDSTTLNKEKWKQLSRSLDYSEKPEKPEESKPSDIRLPNAPVNSEALKLIVFVIVIAFIIFILYRLNVFKLVASLFRRTSEDEVADDSIEEDNIAPSTDLYNAALKESDRALSLKLLYLACLHFLAESSVIRLRKETTNAMYLRALSGKPFHSDLRTIVRLHELSWFGDKQVSAEEYEHSLQLAKKIMAVR